MRKLQSILKSDCRTLKIWESKNKLRGEVYDENGNLSMAADFYYKDGDMDEYRVRTYFGFTNFCRVPFERKNGKIILYPINKNRRVIWTNDDYDEWKDCMLKDNEDEETLTYERYYNDCDLNLDDERCNLNTYVDGYIVAFASLGLWFGRRNGAKIVGEKVSDILSSDCDYVTWYCDRYNVRCDGTHHDGKNHILYRVAKNKEHAEWLVDKIAYDNMSEEEFKKRTKSLRPYVAKVYGW